MSTVVQTRYAPQMQPGVVGMIADMTGWDVSTYICETVAGIGFGLAVSQGVNDKGCVLGGTTTAFRGITVRDVTLDRLPIDPLAAAGTLLAADTYARYQNVAVMSRGTIWVMCYGGGDGGVRAGDPLYYDVNGHFTNSAAGTASVGGVSFANQPAVGDTLTVNGAVWTWVDEPTSGLQLRIGPTLGDSMRTAAATLDASTNAGTQVMNFRSAPSTSGPPGLGSGADSIIYSNVADGLTTYTITSDTAGATVTPMQAGVAAAVLITGGYWKSSAIAGQIAKVSLGIQR